MARRIYLWLPSLTVLALSACSGADTGFFSPVLTAGAGGSSHAGASSSAGSTSISGSTGQAGSPPAGGAGRTGASSGGAQTGGASSGGASTGGANSAGGVAGRAAGGAGGTGASAGHAGANGGSANAGAGGSNPDSICKELLKQADQQLEAARECNLAADALQCTGKVTNQCGCQVPVQRTDSTATKAYLKTQQLLEDKGCIIACTAIACPSVTNAQCKASGTGAMGTCVSTTHGPTP